MYIRASAPDAPPLSDTAIGCFISLFFWIAACIIRAIWSEAPPAPAATTISTGLVGSQAAIAGALASMAVTAAVALIMLRTCFSPMSSFDPRMPDLAGKIWQDLACKTWLCQSPLCGLLSQIQAGLELTSWDFSMRLQALSAALWPVR